MNENSLLSFPYSSRILPIWPIFNHLRALRALGGFVIYIIEANAGNGILYKIGTTKGCPWRRYDQLRRQNAFPLRLVGALIGDKTDEMRLHQLFTKWRLHGEWFSDCSPIRRLINDFPIEKWDETIEIMHFREIPFSEIFHSLTPLKFESVPSFYF